MNLKSGTSYRRIIALRWVSRMPLESWPDLDLTKCLEPRIVVAHQEVPFSVYLFDRVRL